MVFLVILYSLSYLTVYFIQISVDIVKEFLEVDLGRIEKHYYSTGRGDLNLQRKCEASLW